MPNERLIYLFDRLYKNSISLEERNELMLSLSVMDENDNSLDEAVDRYLLQKEGIYNMDDDTAGILLRSILESDKEIIEPLPVHRVHFLRTAWFRYAAAVIILFGVRHLFLESAYK